MTTTQRLIGIVVCLALIFLPRLIRENTTEIAVLTDITENNLSEPNSNDILSLYEFNKNKWNGGIFRLSNISQTSLNTIVQTHIERENQWLSNVFERDKKIINFNKSVEEIINKAKLEPKGKNNSSVYLPIANALKQLNQYESDSNRKILIVYSDLMENTDSFSFYRNKDFALLKTKPEAVESYFDSLLSISSLTHIEIWFIYQPPDAKSDEQFRIISGFYKQMLENKGAKVNISANINL